MPHNEEREHGRPGGGPSYQRLARRKISMPTPKRTTAARRAGMSPSMAVTRVGNANATTMAPMRMSQTRLIACSRTGTNPIEVAGRTPCVLMPQNLLLHGTSLVPTVTEAYPSHAVSPQ